MGLDGKKDVHLDGSSVRPVSRLEVLEGPSGRRVRSEAERARIPGDVRGLVRGSGLEVGPPGGSAAPAGGWITAAE